MLRLVLLALATAALLPRACADSAAAYTSHSFKVPKTHFFPVNPPFRADSNSDSSGSLDINYVRSFGNLTDYNNRYTIYRDGGGSCSLSNLTFWFFCDTTVYDEDGSFAGFVSNSVAVANAYPHAGSLTDITNTPDTGAHPAIPYTDAEAEVSDSASTRYAIWTYTNCVVLSDTKAAHFWNVVKFSSVDSSASVGTTMAIYDLDLDNSTISVTRQDQITYVTTQYAYGSFANVVVDDVAYLYAIDGLYSEKEDIHVAKAPLATFEDTSTWTFYDNSTSSWSSGMPAPTSRNRAGAVINSNMPFSSGNIYYSVYHQQYLLIFFNNYIDSTFRVLTAPSPVGPWTNDNKVLYKTRTGASYNYGAQSTPIYYQSSESAVAGKSIMLAYSYQSSSATYLKALKLDFQ
ncbi:uncharacterized protein V1518DRAFT_422206 [Limtongia smithiae]|uniref:uncharacterized protein n=1 Tax=Limtongia smithiae TaxID=1125753 RepID=UPI0034CFDA67